jgi:hypothetical protein
LRNGGGNDQWIANATELANVAREVGAEVLEGALRYPSDCKSGAALQLHLVMWLCNHRKRNSFDVNL